MLVGCLPNTSLPLHLYSDVVINPRPCYLQACLWLDPETPESAHHNAYHCRDSLQTAPSVCYRTTRWCRPSRSCGRKARNRCKRHGRPEDPSFRNRMKFHCFLSGSFCSTAWHSVLFVCLANCRAAWNWNDTPMSCRFKRPQKWILRPFGPLNPCPLAIQLLQATKQAERVSDRQSSLLRRALGANGLDLKTNLEVAAFRKNVWNSCWNIKVDI